MIRPLIAAAIVALVVLAGALFIGYRSGLIGSQARYDVSAAQLAPVDLHFFGGHTSDDLVDLAYKQVRRVYYKPVDTTALVVGERHGLLNYLKTHHIDGSIPATQATGEPNADLRALDQQLAYVETHYGARLGDKSTVTEAALDGMMAALRDPYSVYMTPQEIRSLNESLSGGNFGGIGVLIFPLRGDVILQPIEGLPAARAGMRVNEVIESVDGHAVRGMTLDRIEHLIRGTEGTTVSITTHPYKGKGVRHYSIVREIIHVPTVHAKMENGYSYIRLAEFGETSADEMRRALSDGKAHGARGYIIDLRDNGGGLLDAAVRISSYFIPSGAIVTEVDRRGNKDTQYATGDAIGDLSPAVVLVNGLTASASEITAGALQDDKAATLIGTRTFGKGVVQGIFQMPNGGALKITTQRYLTRAGRDIQHKGIQPDIHVDQSADLALIDTPRDKQLQAAKAFLARVRR